MTPSCPPDYVCDFGSMRPYVPDVFNPWPIIVWGAAIAVLLIICFVSMIVWHYLDVRAARTINNTANYR